MTRVAVSLLVCTRNRSPSLARTLASIARAAEHAPDIAIEAVIVDNASTDDTPQRLAGWRATRSFPVHVVHEPRPGLARARNAGLALARGKIVAMTDDDCVLHPDYLIALTAAFASAPALAVVGGRILLGDPCDLPVTVKLEDHPMVAAPGAFPGGFVMGANLTFTRDVISHVGPFDERFGAGARFVSAEDTDFLFRAIGLGVPVVYDPRLVVDHHHGRRRPAEVIALLAGYGYGDGALYAKHLLADRRILRAILADLCAIVDEVRADTRPFPFIRRFHLFRFGRVARGFVAYCGSRVRAGWSGPGSRVRRGDDPRERVEAAAPPSGRSAAGGDLQAAADRAA